MQENINIPDSEITTNLSFRQLVLMNMQQLTNFPYIEKDFDALTDYELLCLVVKFLNDVIANQNEQNASITRMYQSFLALQDYVNNTKDELETAFNNLDNYVRYYFDNLDVQEEINNKLDKMLEDGVLEQIIEQFIQSTAIWGFDTVNDLKNATNLINGSFSHTTGYSNINDGNGGFYKIRNKTDEDIIDDINIIELSNNLVAEYINNNQMKRLVSLTKVDNGETYNLLLSISFDGINFGNLITLKDIEISHADRNVAVNFCYIHNKFYILTSIGYWYSDDLINWSERKILGEGISAPSIYNDILYFHHQDSSQTIINDVGMTTYQFSINKAPITFNEDGSIDVGEYTQLISSSQSSSHIDPVVIEFKEKLYLCCKDEIAVNIELYEITNNGLIDTGFSHRGIGIEAPKLIANDDYLYIYADPYGIQTNYNDTKNVSYDRGLSVRITAITPEGINNDALLTPINLSYNYHPAFALFDNLNTIKLFNQFKTTPIILKPTQYYKQVNFDSSKSNEIISVLNHPLRPLFITGNTSNNIGYLRFTKVFEDSPLMIRFDPSSGTNIRPAQGVNGKTDTSSTDNIIRENEIIIAPLYNTSNNTFVFLPIERYEFRRQLETLPNNQSIQTSLNEKFLKSNTVNFFKISGYGSDISINKLPTASNFFGEYYKESNNFGHLKLYRIGDVVIEYQATISSGVLSEWTQTH